MHKKILVICAALIAFAAMAAVPALASINLTLQKNGSTVLTGTLIQATNEGNILFDTSIGSLSCTGSTLTEKVTANSGSELIGIIESASFTGAGSENRCTTSFIGDVKYDSDNLPWCIKAGGKLATDTFEMRGGGCSESSKSLQLTLTGSATCIYTRPNVTGSYTTNGTQAILTIGASQIFNAAAGSGFICPSAFTLTGKYKLESHEPPPSALTIVSTL
jgi:hypothetical protein